MILDTTVYTLWHRRVLRFWRFNVSVVFWCIVNSTLNWAKTSHLSSFLSRSFVFILSSFARSFFAHILTVNLCHDVMMLKLSVKTHVNILWKFYQNIYNSERCVASFDVLHLLPYSFEWCRIIFIMSLIVCVRVHFAKPFYLSFVLYKHRSNIYVYYLQPSPAILCFIYVADNWFCVFGLNLFCALHF